MRDEQFIKFLYEATLEGKIPLTRDFVTKLYQIDKKVKYDDIGFDSALKYAREKLSEKIGNFSPLDTLNIFNLSKVLRFKCGFRDIQAGLERFNKFLKSKKGFDDVKGKTLIEYLFQATLDKKLPITFDFYLKYYQMVENKRLEKQYDFILLDEAQDTNEIMLDIFLENDCKKIFVGDTFQSIYGFNDSINAFEIVKTKHHLSLWQSFRCKQEILDYAMFFLRVFADKDFMPMISGFSGDEEITTRAFISRTNAGIMRFLVDLYESDDNIEEYRLLKELDSIFKPIWAIEFFSSKEFDRIPQRYSYIKKFNNFKELEEYIEEVKDAELEQAIKLSGGLSRLEIIKIQNLAQSLYVNKNAKNTITNAHQSKGLEFDEVILGSDFFDLNEMWQEMQTLKNKASDLESKAIEAISLESEARLSEIALRLRNKANKKRKTLQQELNLFYVAITRAKKRLIDKSSNKELYIKCNDWHYGDVLI